MPDLIIKNHEHIQSLIINRPERRNALNQSLLQELSVALDSLRHNQQVRVLIISGSGDKAFCAGADLKERQAMSETEAFNFVKLIQATVQKIAELEIPSIAAINGSAFGGGLELALACDLRVCAPNLRMGLTECSLGIIPGAGGTQRLPRLIGLSRAMEMIFTARRVTSTEAQAIGLVNYVADDSQEYALKLASLVAEQAPLAVKAAKKAMLSTQAVSHKDLAAELSVYQEILGTKDRLEGLTAFNDKRKPLFLGC